MAKQNGDRAVMQNAVKTLATNIRFASVDNPVRSIVVTSSIPSEGKSTIAVALSEALASGGKSVLLVECDMRRRSIAGMLGVHAQSGLYAVLASQIELEDAVVRTSMRGVSFLDAEPHIPNPVDILGSRRFHSFVESLKSSYDYVVFDTPPLSAFVDAAVIGSVVDGSLLVVRRNFVRREAVVSSLEQLKKAGANVLGTVLNYCENERSDYYYEYYNKNGSKRDQGSDMAAPQIPSAPAQRQVATPRTRTATAHAQQKSTLRPIPSGVGSASPDSTSQFLAQAGYRPHYSDDDE
jgi:capsular exopolysaccharide synthesis family protein